MCPTGEEKGAEGGPACSHAPPPARQARQHPPDELRLLTLPGLRKTGDVSEVHAEESTGLLHPAADSRGSERAAALPQHHHGGGGGPAEAVTGEARGRLLQVKRTESGFNWFVREGRRCPCECVELGG